MRGFQRPGERESVWALTSFRIFKALAKFPVELVSVSQERVERTLLAKIVYHGIVGNAAQGESACRLFHHYEHQHGYLGLHVAWYDARRKTLFYSEWLGNPRSRAAGKWLQYRIGYQYLAVGWD